MVFVSPYGACARLALTIALALSLSGCDGGTGTSPFSGASSDVIGPPAEIADTVRVDVYVDATPSMEGYAIRESAYGQFLYALDRNVTSGWVGSDVRFFMFGTRAESIDRATFLSARTDRRFYYRPGLFLNTHIEVVLAQADPERVTIIVTDLFQSDGDTNLLIELIKDEALARELDTAILAIPSEFQGRVYDAPGGWYRYATTAGDETTYRPFYAIMFGKSSKIDRLFETLRSRPFVSPERFLVISPYVVDDYHVALSKTRESHRITPPGSREPNEFSFNIQSGGEGGTLEASIVVVPQRYAPRVAADRLELVAYRKIREGREWSVDSVRVDDFRLEQARWSGDTLHVTIDYRLSEPAGVYAYLVVLQAGSIEGLRVPNWVDGLSSTNPTAQRDPNKTLNLVPLVEGLLQAQTTLRQPLLAQFLVTVRKS